MMQEIHILRPDLSEIIDAFDLHRLRLDPCAVLPIAPLRRDLADIDLGVEVRRKGIAVVAAVAVEDIDIVDLIKLMLHCICTEHSRYARIKARAKERRQPRLTKAVRIRPLPAVFKFCRILRLVIRRVHIVCSCRKTCIHNMQILIWES